MKSTLLQTIGRTHFYVETSQIPPSLINRLNHNFRQSLRFNKIAFIYILKLGGYFLFVFVSSVNLNFTVFVNISLLVKTGNTCYCKHGLKPRVNQYDLKPRVNSFQMFYIYNSYSVYAMPCSQPDARLKFYLIFI